MKVLFDNSIFGLQRVGGASNYFAHLINGLRGMSDVDLPAVYSNNIYLDKISQDVIPQKHFLLSKYFYMHLNNNFSLDLIKVGNYDIFHHTYYDNYFLSKFSSTKPLVITIHDMVHEKFPNLFKFSKIITSNKKKLVDRADKIIAISQRTKNDLCEIFGTNEEKIEVIYHGTNLLRQSNQSLSLNLPIEYLLFVGVRSGYKNFEWMLTNLARILKQRNIFLLCIGSCFTTAESKLISELKIQHLVVNKFVNTSADLQEVYSRAKLFIYPSLYEGFGMPILEAFASNVPVLLSNCSCFPEIAMDGAMYFNAGDRSDFIDKVNFLLDDPQFVKHLVMNAHVVVDKFSWESTVRETFDLYKSLM